MLVTMRIASRILTSKFFENLTFTTPSTCSDSLLNAGGTRFNELKRKKRTQRTIAQDRLAAFCEVHCLPEPEYTLRSWSPPERTFHQAQYHLQPALSGQRPPTIGSAFPSRLQNASHQMNDSCPCIPSTPCLSLSGSREESVLLASPTNPDSKEFPISVSALPDASTEVGDRRLLPSVSIDMRPPRKQQAQVQASIGNMDAECPYSTALPVVDSQPSIQHMGNCSYNLFSHINDFPRYGFHEKLYTCRVQITIPGGYGCEEKVFVYSSPKGLEYEVAAMAKEDAARVALEGLMACEEFRH